MVLLISQNSTHGDSRSKKMLTKDDYIIVCGDFGLVWDNTPEELYWRKWLDEKPWTTLFVDGNHENFPLLYSFPRAELFGGTVHKISGSIYHLMRGEIYEIEGKRFLAMGGAASHDKKHRVEGRSWWQEEIPNESEIDHALDSLKASGESVDFILTHCSPLSIEQRIGYGSADRITNFLQRVYDTVEFKHWFCGHYHEAIDVTDKFHIIYEDILQIV